MKYITFAFLLLTGCGTNFRYKIGDCFSDPTRANFYYKVADIKQNHYFLQSIDENLNQDQKLISEVFSAPTPVSVERVEVAFKQIMCP